MLFSIDLSSLATFFGIVVAVLTGLVYWGKPNFLVYLEMRVTSELETSNRELLDKAERYSHGIRLSGPKTRIRRRLSSFSHDYVVPNHVIEVSALATVAWLFCFFLIGASFIYTGIQSITLLNIILLTAQTNMAVMLFMTWYNRNNSIEEPMLFLMTIFFWWGVFTLAGVINGVCGLYIPIIPIEYLHYAYYSFSLIPFIPIFWAVCVAFAFRNREKQKYEELREAVLAFEKFRKEESQRKK